MPKQRKRGRPSLGDAARRNCVTVKLTDAERAAWAAAAGERPLSEWLRELANAAAVLKFALVAAVALAACGDNLPGPIGQAVIERCGLAPTAPGWTVEINPDAGTAVLAADQMLAIDHWRLAILDWEDCVYGVGSPAEPDGPDAGAR